MLNAFACLTDKRYGTFSRARSHFWVLFHFFFSFGVNVYALPLMNTDYGKMLVNGPQETGRETLLSGGFQELKLLMIPFPNSRQKISCGHFTQLSGSKIYVLQAVKLEQSQNRYLYHVRIRTSKVDLLSQHHQC